MRRHLVLVALILTGVGVPSGAAAQETEPEDPPPIEDFWTAEEEAIAREQAAADAEAQAAPPPAPAAVGVEGEPVASAPACSPPVTLRRTLDALQRAARRPLPARPGRRMRAVTMAPCAAGRLRVELRTAGSDVLLARDTVALRDTTPVRLRLRTTSAVRRYAGRGPIRLLLRVRLEV